MEKMTSGYYIEWGRPPGMGWVGKVHNKEPPLEKKRSTRNSHSRCLLTQHNYD